MKTNKKYIDEFGSDQIKTKKCIANKILYIHGIWSNRLVFEFSSKKKKKKQLYVEMTLHWEGMHLFDLQFHLYCVMLSSNPKVCCCRSL